MASALLLFGALQTAQAGLSEPEPLPTLDLTDTSDYYLFKSGEVFIDLYGTVIGGSKLHPKVAGGGGIGGGFFFNRYMGVMAEGYLLDLPDYTGSLAGGLVVRLPVDDICTAFYGFALFGADFSDETRDSQSFGGGFDVRMTDHTSLFADARTVFVGSGQVDNEWLIRSGIRFVF
jgi:hypothetical protein